MRVINYGRLNWMRAFVFNVECLDILCVVIKHPSEKLWSLEFLESFHCSISSVFIYCRPQSYIRVISYGRLNLPRAFMFNFELLDIFCVRIGHLSEKLWPFEFLESFRYSFLSISIYCWPWSDILVKSFRRMNMPCASMFNSERLDILWAWIGHSSEKLWPFELLESFHCSFLSFSIYHGFHSYTRVKKLWPFEFA